MTEQAAIFKYLPTRYGKEYVWSGDDLLILLARRGLSGDWYPKYGDGPGGHLVVGSKRQHYDLPDDFFPDRDRLAEWYDSFLDYVEHQERG